MMEQERISIFRLVPLVIILGATAIVSCILGYLYKIYWDEGLCVLFIDVVFLLIFLFNLEYERLHQKISQNLSTSFQRIMFGYVVCCIIVGGIFYFCPAFFAPMLLLPLIMNAFSNESISFFSGVFFCLLFEMVSSGSNYEIICYLMLISLGCALGKTLSERKYRLRTSIILFCSNILIPGIFYYLEHGKIQAKIYLFGLVPGLITALFCLFLFSRIKSETDSDLDNKLWDIISDEYSLVIEMKNHFPADYAHAKLVSEIAMKYASRLNYSQSLCAAAGFYYRIGKLVGEPYVQNGVEKAIQMGFPVEVIRILSEYNGQEKLPQTPESAMIQMINATALKMDALHTDVGMSNWNREMIIYQTLNELSSQGMYDECGLSMNQFLKIREFLVKEERIS